MNVGIAALLTAQPTVAWLGGAKLAKVKQRCVGDIHIFSPYNVVS